MALDDKRHMDIVDQLASDLDRNFQHLVLHFQQRLYAFALRQTGSPQDAEDIAQEAFIRAYHALADYPAERIRALKLQPWLYKITLHICYRHSSNARLQCTSLDTSADGELLDLPGNEDEQPEKVLENREEVRELEACISQLPTQYRVAVNCYYFAELSYQEIAELLNLPTGTVKSHVYRGTQHIKKIIQKQQRTHVRGLYGA